MSYLVRGMWLRELRLSHVYASSTPTEGATSATDGGNRRGVTAGSSLARRRTSAEAMTEAVTLAGRCLKIKNMNITASITYRVPPTTD